MTKEKEKRKATIRLPSSPPPMPKLKIGCVVKGRQNESSRLGEGGKGAGDWEESPPGLSEDENDSDSTEAAASLPSQAVTPGRGSSFNPAGAREGLRIISPIHACSAGLLSPGPGHPDLAGRESQPHCTVEGTEAQSPNRPADAWTPPRTLDHRKDAHGIPQARNRRYSGTLSAFPVPAPSIKEGRKKGRVRNSKVIWPHIP